MSTLRKVTQVIEPQFVMEGAGVRLRRSISPHASNQHDPFLLFDHFAFNDPIEGPIRGFPMHPHRGIETVTYMLEGSVNHRDSLGNSGLIGPGDVQWMTAGSGILHEEMPRRGPNGEIYGFQLWVNLPAKLKMMKPIYQEVKSKSIPSYEKDGVRVRIVAGTVDNVVGSVTEIAANPLYMDVTISPDSEWQQVIPYGHTLRVYVFEGDGDFGLDETGNGTSITAVKMLLFNDGDLVRVKSYKESSVRFMLMAGIPFNEPIVPYGPFVMNTAEEIQQALLDLRNGTFVKSTPGTSSGNLEANQK
jgi:redox-sensitive bicupin YhaK (pirin superfamily)